MRAIILIAAVATLSSCSAMTIQEQANFKQLDDPKSNLCAGSSAVRKYSFLLHAYTKRAQGLTIQSSQSNSQDTIDNTNWVAANFVKLILTSYLTQNVPTADSNSEKLSGSTVAENSNLWLVKTRINWLSKEMPLTLAWASENEFYLWDSGAIDAEHPSANWIKSIRFDGAREDGLCNKFHDYTGGRHGILGCHSYIPPSGLLSFAGVTGFKAAEFIETHYFTAPDAQKEYLCVDAGLQKNCFDFQDDHKISVMREALEKNETVKTKFPFLSRSGFMGASFQEIKSDQETIRGWQSALFIDLVLLSSVKISKTVAKDFINYRIDWNPERLCKYGRSKSELYTH